MLTRTLVSPFILMEALSKEGLFVGLIDLKFENPIPSFGKKNPFFIFSSLFSSCKILTA